MVVLPIVFNAFGMGQDLTESDSFFIIYDICFNFHTVIVFIFLLLSWINF